MSKLSQQQAQALAQQVREACVEVAQTAYEDASISGLCGVGAWECALGAIRDLDLQRVLDVSVINRSP